MIIRRYITKEVATVFASILLILTVALLSQQFVRYLNYVAVGKAPANAVFSLVGLEIPYLFTFLLPLSIYLSLLWVYSRLQIDHEMIVLEMSGFGIQRLGVLTMILGCVVALCVLLLMFWVNPWASVKRQVVLGSEENTAHLIQTLIPGRFHISADETRVIYVETLSRDRTEAENIFIAEAKVKHGMPHREQWDIITAKKGIQTNIQNQSENYFLLQNGYRYEGVPGQNDYTILKFSKYAIQLPDMQAKLTRNHRETLSLSQLIENIHNIKYNAELQWRVFMPIATIVLSFIALSFSYFSPRQNQYKRMVPAILIFILYINLALLSKRWLEEGRLSPWIGLWWVHAIFIVIAFYFIRLHYYRRS